jgi:FkbM family methyltransferase
VKQSSKPRTFMQRVAHKVLRTRGIGKPLCAASYRMGLQTLSRRGSRHSGYVPDSVPLPIDGASRRGSISSARGNDHVARTIWLDGLLGYETPMPELYMRLVRGADTILDVGANTGLYAILAGLTEPRCRVVSFEPLPDAIRCLKANIKSNGLEHQVTVVEAAVGVEVGTAQFFIPEKNFGDTIEQSASLVKEFREKHSAVLDVKVETVDNYVATHQPAKISMIRADVEGAEHLVLGGARKTLQTHRPTVFVEVLADVTAGYLEPIRAEAGYCVLAIGDGTLTELPAVRRFSVDNFNQLWFPPESRPQIERIAEDLKMKWVASD